MYKFKIHILVVFIKRFLGGHADIMIYILLGACLGQHEIGYYHPLICSHLQHCKHEKFADMTKVWPDTPYNENQREITHANINKKNYFLLETRMFSVYLFQSKEVLYSTNWYYIQQLALFWFIESAFWCMINIGVI